VGASRLPVPFTPGLGFRFPDRSLPGLPITFSVLTSLALSDTTVCVESAEDVRIALEKQTLFALDYVSHRPLGHEGTYSVGSPSGLWCCFTSG
jgi:hypothetical protein